MLKDVILFKMNGVLKDIAKIFASLPGLGPRSARRISITLALQKDDTTKKIITLLQKMQQTIKKCEKCNNLSEETVCYICKDYSRDHNQICIVSEITDLWAIERMGQYEGVYHVLGGELSIANAITPDDLNFEKLEETIMNSQETKECIIAMNPTINGQATVHYIHEILKKYDNIVISTLSLGIPMGSELDYLDTGTIAMALASRKELS